MTDYKKQSNWRERRALEKKKQSRQAVVLCLLMVLVYGFVGYLQQEPLVVEVGTPVAMASIDK